MKLSSEVGNAISSLNASSDKVAPTDHHLFLLPSHVCLCHHRKAQKLQWVNTVELLLHAWDPSFPSILGYGAWLCLAQCWELLEGCCPRVCYRPPPPNLPFFPHAPPPPPPTGTSAIIS